MTADDESTPYGRRVVTGVDSAGKSTVVSDAIATATVSRPGGATVTEIWRADQLPIDVRDLTPLEATDVVGPPGRGLAVRICTFPPDDEVDLDDYKRYNADVESSYSSGTTQPSSQIPGMHRTETVDVVTVVAGQLTVVTETGEVVLGAGESVVQRGTIHAWRNRSNQTAVAVAIMMAAADREHAR